MEELAKRTQSYWQTKLKSLIFWHIFQLFFFRWFDINNKSTKDQIHNILCETCNIILWGGFRGNGIWILKFSLFGSISWCIVYNEIRTNSTIGSNFELFLGWSFDMMGNRLLQKFSFLRLQEAKEIYIYPTLKKRKKEQLENKTKNQKTNLSLAASNKYYNTKPKNQVA